MSNVLPIEPPPDPALWEGDQMRAILAARDISALYRQLRKVGISQRRIAQLTQQHHADITEVARGRQIQSYDVLARIADGLGIPRGYMGLAYTNTPSPRFGNPPSNPEGNSMQRRDFLGLVSKLVMGAALTPAEIALLAGDPHPTPIPHRIGAADVTRLRVLTAGLRAYDVEHGGGSCRNAVLAQLNWAESLKTATYSDQLRPALFDAVAELKTLAAFSSAERVFA